MNHRAELKKFAEDWKKYRRMQRKLTKLRKQEPGKRDVKQTTATLANINHHIKTLDERIDDVLQQLKAEPQLPSMPANKKTYIN